MATPPEAAEQQEKEALRSWSSTKYAILKRNLGITRRIDSAKKLHPEYLGTNIYGLKRVLLDDGPHLVGTISKMAVIYDFTEDEVVYDFSDFGGTPRAGGDTYGAVAEWNGKYYFGGWVIGDQLKEAEGGSIYTGDKYAYILETEDLERWNVILKDKSDPDKPGYKAEVTDLKPTSNGLYICRGDGGQGAEGFYKYDGETITQLTSDSAMHVARVPRHYAVYGSRGSTVITKVAEDETISDLYDLTDIHSKAKGTKTLGRPGMVTTDGVNTFVGDYDGLFVRDDNFIPFLIEPISDTTKRCAGWRADPILADGKLVFPMNHFDPGSRVFNVPSYLIAYLPPYLRIIGKSNYIAGMEIYDGSIYYGSSAVEHVNNFNDIQNTTVDLGKVDLAEIDSIKIPFIERIYHTDYTAGSSGHNGILGGVPSLGYDYVRFRIKSDTAGTMTFYEWDSERDAVTLGDISYNAGDEKIIETGVDIQEATGGIVGFEFDSDASITGMIRAG